MLPHACQFIATIVHGCWLPSFKNTYTSQWHFFPSLKMLMLVNLYIILPEYSFFGHLFLLTTCWLVLLWYKFSILQWELNQIGGLTCTLCTLYTVPEHYLYPVYTVHSTWTLAASRALDAGACGIVAPMISSREDAQRLVDQCRYTVYCTLFVV